MRHLRDRRVLFCAFNRHVAAELRMRVDTAEVSTLHAAGWKLVRQHCPRARIDKDKVAHQLWDRVKDREGGRELFRSRARDIVDEVARRKAAGDCLDRDNDDPLMASVWSRRHDPALCDFDDMVYVPILKGWRADFDIVLVDEAQDLSPSQMQLVQLLGRRVVAVGDTSQSIYGFRGAHHDAMAVLERTLDARSLGMTTCFRCAASIVSTASTVAPEIRPAENAAEGSVQRISYKRFTDLVRPDDFVLCRTTRPLLEYALATLASGGKAHVIGMDIVKEVSSASRFVQGGTRTEGATPSVPRNPSSVLSVVRNQPDLARRAEQNGGGAKGLETDNVFILRPDLIPHPSAETASEIQQERHLWYVAVTRAKRNLYVVDHDID